MTSPSVSRRWCFTVNNYNEDDETLFKEQDATYLVYGKEIGDSGTPHLQGFITFKTNKRLSALKKIHSTAHWEIAKGTSPQAADYCKKDGDYYEAGSLPTQGKRTDLESACDKIKQGATLKTVAEEHSEIFVKFGRGLRDLQLTLNVSYDHHCCRGIWIWGPPGSGKSHTARKFSEDLFLKPQSKWWDGYNNQSVVLLDDLDTSTLGHYLKIWSDKYSCTGETKGGTVNLRHQLFIVTSNYSPDSLFSEDPVMAEAIKRRFKIIKKEDRSSIIDYAVFKQIKEEEQEETITQKKKRVRVSERKILDSP